MCFYFVSDKARMSSRITSVAVYLSVRNHKVVDVQNKGKGIQMRLAKKDNF